MDTREPELILEKLDTVVDGLKCATKLNVALGSVTKNEEEGNCRFQCAHENNTLLERSDNEAIQEVLSKIKNLLSSTDVIESCTR